MPSCSTYDERCEDWSEEVGGGEVCRRRGQAAPRVTLHRASKANVHMT